MNVIFVSHCDFRGNSAMHIFSIANELQSMGVECAVCVPNDPAWVHSHGTPLFQVRDYEEASRQAIVFPDGRGPDLIHAWTPRERVRKLTEALVGRYEVPYLVHLEDNEEVIVENELGVGSFAELSRLPLSLLDQLVADYRSHPVYYPRFLAGAVGVTALMDRLLEFKPAHVPGAVFWPGFDSAFARATPDPDFRRRMGLGSSDLIAAYTGDVHGSNIGEVCSLVAAIAALRRRGHPLVLFKTGRIDVEIPYFEEAKKCGAVVDLGFRSRDEIPGLVANADVLVQPGRAGHFNDFRFPSKLPEFLVSGKPVVLPNTNIGRFLRDDIEAVVLEEGHALEIAARLEPLLQDPERRERIGAAGREFALRELTWPRNVERVKAFYDQILGSASRSAAVDERESGATGLRLHRPADDWSAGREWHPKLIAFYLPQFHRIPENDEWWGEGFTEWTNVRRARPSFPGHEQPMLPSDLGYYDLLQPDVLSRQADLARSYGIHGFCIHYYWFSGRRVLERPLDQLLAQTSPDFPFCICWANENWTRRWDGSDHEILLKQDYSEGFAEDFIRDVIPILKDPRYIRVDGAPILLVYRVDQIPDAPAAAKIWRRICAEEGIPGVHLAAVRSFGTTDPRPFGFDAAVEFPPHVLPEQIDPATVKGVAADFRGYLFDYPRLVRTQIAQPAPPYVRYRGVMPAWDNTPRRMQDAHVWVDSSPAEYEIWLERTVEQAMARSEVQEPLVFLNAWNEWAEGAFLEPDRVNGYARLEATKRGLLRGTAADFRRRGFPVSEHIIERAILAEAVAAAKGLLQ